MEFPSKNSSSPEAKLLRKSPRLLPLSPESKSKKRSSPSKSEDSSVRVVVAAVYNQEQEANPLDIYNPNAAVSPRISPRFTTNVFKRASNGSSITALPFSVPVTISSSPLRLNLRKRQRLEESSSELSGSGSGTNHKKVRGYELGLNLRRSPRLIMSLDRANGRNSQSALLALSRKSISLGSTPMQIEKMSKSQLVSMDSRKLVELLLRSSETKQELAKTPNDSIIVGEKLSRSMESELEIAKTDLGTVTPANDNVGERDLNSGGNFLTSGEIESNFFSEKCLRSRKIPLKAVRDDHVSLNGGNSNTGQSLITSKKKSDKKVISFFVGEPFTEEEAMKRWQWRYDLKNKKSKRNQTVLNAGEEDETILNVQFHYAQASVSGCIFNVGDCALIKGEGKKHHVGKIVEFFKTMDGEDYFRVQWFYRAEETVMKEAGSKHDKKRVFYSTIENDNPLDCIVSKVNIIQIPNMVSLKQDDIPPTDFYYDMEYCVEYSTFRNLRYGDKLESEDSVLPCHQPESDVFQQPIAATPLPSCESLKAELTLLDLFSGCGGMSTGLSLGAKLSGINLVTRWAVDFEKAATDSVKLNHPETQARNESAADFLELLKSWEKLCQRYVFSDSETIREPESNNEADTECTENLDSDKDKDSDSEYEVSHLIDVCHGDPNDTGMIGIHFRVSWKGYGADEDTWEPINGLSNCKDKIADFVKNGFRSKILPLPGDAEVICGGPPCQGISGYNRHRNVDAPLTDEKNHQLVVFMDIVEFLKPKYVLMENVTDILRFGGASLGRYALSRLVCMKYQARLGTIAAGCYGLPQFRLRVFLWGAISSEKLPPFPLPTHEVVVKYWPPLEFERNTVAYDEGQKRKLQDAVVLSDAISDLPPVTCNEKLDEMPYAMPPITEFQRNIRRTKEEMMGITSSQITATNEPLLYDHRAYSFSEDNRLRVTQIPRKKGANFRDLPGVIVANDKTVRRDPSMPPAVLPSGELLVPECVFNYEKGKSRRPLARVWWDETVPTVLTFPYFLAQAILHPEQDRVLTIRECARLQGFPDYYRFCGSVKERYCQVGNAVAIPVGKALGYALGMAYQKLTDDNPLITLSPDFGFRV